MLFNPLKLKTLKQVQGDKINVIPGLVRNLIFCLSFCNLFLGCFPSGLVSASLYCHSELVSESHLCLYLFQGSIEGALFNPLKLKTLKQVQGDRNMYQGKKQGDKKVREWQKWNLIILTSKERNKYLLLLIFFVIINITKEVIRWLDSGIK